PAGAPRFSLGASNGLIDINPLYNANIVNQAIITTATGRQRLEVKVNFDARNPSVPPSGPVTIFGLQVQDQVPAAGLANVQQAFEFNRGDSVTVFDTATNQQTVFDHTQLPDVPLTTQTPLLRPDDVIRAIDRSPLVSNSDYPVGQGPALAF